MTRLCPSETAQFCDFSVLFLLILVLGYTLTLFEHWEIFTPLVSPELFLDAADPQRPGPQASDFLSTVAGFPSGSAVWRGGLMLAPSVRSLVF